MSTTINDYVKFVATMIATEMQRFRMVREGKLSLVKYVFGLLVDVAVLPYIDYVHAFVNVATVLQLTIILLRRGGPKAVLQCFLAFWNCMKDANTAMPYAELGIRI